MNRHILPMALFALLTGCGPRFSATEAERAERAEPVRLQSEPWRGLDGRLEVYAPRGWVVHTANTPEGREQVPASILEHLVGDADAVTFDPTQPESGFVAVLITRSLPTYEGWREDSVVFFEAIYGEIYPGFEMLGVDTIDGGEDTLLVQYRYRAGDEAWNHVEERYTLGGERDISVICVAGEDSTLGELGWCEAVADRVHYR